MQPLEQSAHTIVAGYIATFLPGVEAEYEVLEEVAEARLELSLFDLQMETLVFGLHCLDRAALAELGAERRAKFMDCAFDTACDAFCDSLPSDAREKFAQGFGEHCKTRQLEYGAMKLLPADGEKGLKNTLAWEYAKRVCTAAGVWNPIALKLLFDEALEIFMLMVRSCREMGKETKAS